MTRRTTPGGARRVGGQVGRKPIFKASRALLLYLLPLPVLFASLYGVLYGNMRVAIGAGVGFALAMFGAQLVRQGLTLEVESRRRKIVRRLSTVPYKLIGHAVVGGSMAVVALSVVGHSIPTALLVGIASALGSFLVYGLDPSRSLPDAPAVGVTSEEVIEILNEADGKIAGIEAAADQIRNLELKQRLQGIVGGIREITDIVEDDPRDLRRARKFLKVYLDGARRVTEGYAATHPSNQSGELEDNFRSVLGTMETVIAEQKERLLENNLTELDVQIEVLQTQLEREGV
jgi:hypothetical protein